MAWAISSLPVPDSPRMSTVVLVARHLRHLLVHLAHRAAGADDVARRRSAPAAPARSWRVLVEEPAASPPRTNRAASSPPAPVSARDDLEELARARSYSRSACTPARAERADGSSGVEDGTQTNSSHCPARSDAAPARLRKSGSRLTSGTRSASRSDDAADDALADPVPGAKAFGGDADPRLDRQLVGVGIAEDERRLHHVVVIARASRARGAATGSALRRR